MKNLHRGFLSLVAWIWVLGSVSAGADETLLKAAVFCHGLQQNQAPKEPAAFFLPNETIYLSIELKGRPKSGKVATQFLFRDSIIASAEVDVATVNKGVLMSVGQSTFAGFDLTHEQPLPVGDCYSAVVTLDGKPLGTFPFRVAPPKGAMPSKLKRVALSRNVDEEKNPVEETREFDSKEKVVLSGVADLGLSTWIEVSWHLGGVADAAGTRSLTLKENKPDCPFFFSFIPNGGWPAGEHEAVLQMNGAVVAREKFTIKNGPPLNFTVEPDTFQFSQDDGEGKPGRVVDSFASTDRVMHATWTLKQPALAKGLRFVWTAVDAAGAKNHVVANATAAASINQLVNSTLRARSGLPRGTYKVELYQDDRLLDTRNFDVK